MNDPRYRLLAVAALSGAAFLSVTGAVGAALWWLVCSNRTLPSGRAVFYLGVTVLLAAAATAVSGGDGVSYFVRISAVLLIAAHAYVSQRDGDLFDLGAWLGARAGLPAIGFDLGLTAELTLGSLAAAADDLAQIRLAVEQKRLPLLPRWFAVGAALLHAELRRGRELAGLIALRGYGGGGVHVPHFAPTLAERLSAGAAISVLLFAILGPRDIFILSL
ncbi:MAG: hypothetical protein ABFC38_14050 [Methanospirillum sp.]